MLKHWTVITPRFLSILIKKTRLKPFVSEVEAKRLKSNFIFIKEENCDDVGRIFNSSINIKPIEEALRYPIKNDYFCLLSGLDYPIQPPEYINSFFVNNSGHEFITLHDTTKSTLFYDKYVVSRFCVKPICPIALIYRTALFHKMVESLNMRLSKIIPTNTKSNLEKYMKGMTVYGGLQWWAFSYKFLEYIHEFCKKNPNFIRCFKRSVVPDESFFQTIIGNSPYKNKIKYKLTYDVKWGKGYSYTKLNERNIDNVEIDDIERLKSKDKFTQHGEKNRNTEVLFIRKISNNQESVSKKIDEIYLKK